MIENLESYSIKNFISFMDEVYFRLFVRQFEAWWPAHLFLMALGLAIVVLACMGKVRTVAAALALPLAACAITFHLQLYAELTPVGKYFGWAFLIQIPLILIWGFVTKSRERFQPKVHTFTGLAIALFGLIGYPVLSQLGDREWKGAEWFGMAPDPTICFFLGIAVLCARSVWTLLLFPIPLLWAFTTWGTLKTFDAPYAIMLPVIALVAIVTSAWKAIGSFHSRNSSGS